ncbi:MAG: acyl-CoA desaturase [Moorea sp. SIO4A3]|nr:acyl-CoA desaturase [Moorena sp. SIO4A3]
MSISSSAASEVSTLQKTVVTIVIAMSPLGVIAAVVVMFLEKLNVQPIDIGLFLGMYILNFIGITVGYHRLFSHRAFHTVPFIRAFLAIAGCMAAQGPVTSWVHHHRCHHVYSDKDGDTHSPHLHQGGFWGFIQGFWHSHIAWIVNVDWQPPYKYAPDLIKDKLIRRIDNLYVFWVLLSLLIPGFLGGVLTGSVSGFLGGLIWGGAFRIFMVRQITFCVNSVCHLWGNELFTTSDMSKNNPIIAILTLGEGWHNNHHAFPNSARFGHHWWQLDLGWLFILLLKRLGLAWNVKLPSSDQLQLRSI